MYQTSRLNLLTAAEVAVEDILAYYQENKKHLKPYEPVRDSSFYTLREQSQILHEDRERLRNGQALKLYLTLPNNPKIIGLLHFSSLVMGAFCSCFVGYNLHENYVGKGYMTEALKKGIEIMFDDYYLHRIEANIMPSNERSIHVVKKLGFKEEGLAKAYLKINGQWEDHIHYVILNDKL